MRNNQLEQIREILRGALYVVEADDNGERAGNARIGYIASSELDSNGISENLINEIARVINNN